MKKLIALIGAITLTTSVAAVTVVSCGMRTNAINFTINGKDYDKNKDFRGRPQDLMMNILELLTFDKRKYTSEVTANKVLETLGAEAAGKYNLYKLTKDNDEYADLNKRLNSINNDGIKSFDFKWGGENSSEEKAGKVVKGTDLKFTVITQDYDSKNNGSLPKILEGTAPAMDYITVLGNEDIWGEDEAAAKTLKDKFTSLYEKMEFSVIGDLPEGMHGPEGVLEISEEAVKERKFNETFGFNFIKKEGKDDKPDNYVFDIAQAKNTPVGTFEATVGFGDLNNRQKNDVDINLEVRGTELILSPSVLAGQTKTNGKDGDEKVTTKTYILTWLPSVYSYVGSYENLVKKKNIFENIDLELVSVISK